MVASLAYVRLALVEPRELRGWGLCQKGAEMMSFLETMGPRKEIGRFASYEGQAGKNGYAVLGSTAIDNTHQNSIY